jgi:hypothetical protein
MILREENRARLRNTMIVDNDGAVVRAFSLVV